MARADKLQDDEILAAITSIAATGQQPQNKNVRDHLGGRGSYSSISPVLRKWKEQKAAQPPQDAEKPSVQQTEVPTIVRQQQDQLIDLIRQLAESVPLQIDAAVNQERRRARAELDAERETHSRQVQDLRGEIADLMKDVEALEAEAQEKEARIDDLDAQLEQQSAEHDRTLHKIQVEQKLAEEKARKRIEELEAEKEGLISTQATALSDYQKFFEKQIDTLRGDYRQTIEQLSRERKEAEERNELLEKQNNDLSARFDKSITQMRTDHQDSLKQSSEAITDLRKRLDDSEAMRRELDRRILMLLNGKRPEELPLIGVQNEE